MAKDLDEFVERLIEATRDELELNPNLEIGEAIKEAYSYLNSKVISETYENDNEFNHMEGYDVQKSISYSFYECVEFPNLGLSYENITLDEAFEKLEEFLPSSNIPGITFTIHNNTYNWDLEYTLVSGDRVEIDGINEIEYLKENKEVQNAIKLASTKIEKMFLNMFTYYCATQTREYLLSPEGNELYCVDSTLSNHEKYELLKDAYENEIWDEDEERKVFLLADENSDWQLQDLLELYHEDPEFFLDETSVEFDTRYQYYCEENGYDYENDGLEI